MPTYGKLHLYEGTWGGHEDSFFHLQWKKNQTIGNESEIDEHLCRQT